MFPNVRLMIVAVLASIMGISCALGLFAEFRVSHDSFLRESNAGAPLQLGLSGAAAIMDTPATFEIRFQAQPLLRAAGTGIDHQAFDHAVATPGAVAAPKQQPATVPASSINAASSPPEVAGSPQAPAPQAASNTAAEPETPAATGSTAAPDSALLSQRSPQVEPAASKLGDSATADNKPAETKPVEIKPAEIKPAEIKPADNLADRKPAASPPKREAAPSRSTRELKFAPQRAPAAVARKYTTVRHRPLIARRVPRTRAVAPAQGFITAQPAYQWVPQIQSPQPVRRRRIIRRTRPARNSAQPPQPAISNTSAANAPE